MAILLRNNPVALGGDPLTQESTAGEAFQESFGLALESGLLGSAARIDELMQAAGAGSLGNVIPGQAGVALSAFSTIRQAVSPVDTESQVLSAIDARSRLRDAGLDESLSIPEAGIREAALNILIDRKRDELKRQRILDTYGGVATPLLGSLIGTLADPTNIALAFVPVVGEARYAQLLARAGSGLLPRTGVRLGVGAVEGTVGLAPVEALNWAANVQQQADYDSYDFMLALASGTFFGSALHGGAGLLGDLIRPAARRPAAIPRAEATDATGQPVVPPEPPMVDAAARERAYVMDRLAEGKPVTTAQARAAREASLPRTGAEAGTVIDNRLSELQRVSQDGLLAAEQVKALQKESDELRAVLSADIKATGRGAVFDVNRRLTQQERDFIDARRETIRMELERHKTAQSAGKELEKLQKRLDRIDSDADLIKLADELMPRVEAETFVESLSPAIRKALDDDPFAGVRPFIAQSSPETQAAAMRIALAQAARGEPIDVAGAFFTDPKSFAPQEALSAVRANAGKVDGADEAMSRWADELEPLDDDLDSLKNVVADEEAQVMAQLREAGMELTESEAKALADAAAMAKSQGEAAKVAAMCMMRNGV